MQRNHPRDFSVEALQARGKWSDILKYQKIKTVIEEYSINMIQAFASKQKLTEVINTRPALEEMLKGALLFETKGKSTRSFE